MMRRDSCRALGHVGVRRLLCALPKCVLGRQAYQEDVTRLIRDKAARLKELFDVDLFHRPEIE